MQSSSSRLYATFADLPDGSGDKRNTFSASSPSYPPPKAPVAQLSSASPTTHLSTANAPPSAPPSAHPRLVFPVPETMKEWRAWRAHFPLLVLYVWKESCMPCLKVRPAFERLAAELAQRFPGRTLCASDQIDDAHRRQEDTPTFAHWKMCHAVPFFLVFHNGQIVDQLTGYDERQLRTMIENVIQKLGW